MLNRKDRNARASGRGKQAWQGLEGLEPRLLMSDSPYLQYYLTWYQNKTGTTTTTTTGPSNLLATAVGLQVNLTWTAGNGTTGTLTLERSTNNVDFAAIATPAINATSYSDPNRAEATTYYYRLRVTGSATVSTQSFATTPVLNATGLGAVANADGSVQLSWVDNSGVNTGYRVERSTDNQNFGQIGQVAGNANGYTDTATSPSTTYYYRIVTLTSSGSLSPTASVQATTATPPPVVVGPTNMSASAVGLQVNLTWTASTATTGSLTMERSTDNVSFSPLATLAFNATSYSNTNLAEATTYYYRLRLTGAASATAQASATTAVLNASGLGAVANADGSVQLSWNDNSGVNTGYRVERSTDNQTFGQIAQIAGTANGYKDTATSPSTTYWYRLVTLTSSGSLTPTASVQVTTATPAPVVVGPTNMSASAVGLQVNLTWTASTATTGSLTLERSTDNVSFSPLATLAFNATSYSNSNLSEGTTYYYRLRLTGAPSATAQASATTPILNATGLGAVANSDGSVQVNWTDNSAVNTGYRVERSIDNANFSQLVQLAGNATGYKDTTGSPATTYYYRLVTLTSGGSLTPVGSVQVTTAGSQQTPTGPTGLSASVSNLQMNLNWSAGTATSGTLTLERSTDNVTFTPIATLPLTTTFYADMNLAESTTYYYRLRLTGAPAASTQASATTPVLAAANLGAFANADGSVQLQWYDASVVNTGYRVERSTNNVNFSPLATLAGNFGGYKDTSTNYSTTYYYRVVTLTAAGPLTPAGPVQVTTAPVPQVPGGSLNLVVNFGANGISTISYGGVTLYDPANGIGATGGLAHYGTYGADGPQQTSSGNVQSTSWDSVTKTLTQVYPSFILKTQYIVNGSTIDIIAKATNTGSVDAAGVVVWPLFVNMPQAPAGFTGNPLVGFTSKGVVALTADYGSGKMTFVSQDIVQKEIVGWQGPGGQFPNSTFYGLRMGSVGYQGDSNWQVFDNRIVPGATAVIKASLRFSPPGSDVSTIANDVRQAYAATYPYNVQWNDRRMIGTVFLAAPEPGNRTATNPNGWLNDPTIDTTTTAGLEIFRTKMLAFADTVVANLVAHNAQGVMFWDLEGSQYSNINYVGDPRMIGTLSPEMEYKGLIDAFLKKFTDAGLKLGMMLRAAQLQLINGVWEQRGSTNMGQVLIDKMTYARQRWGASIFYIDSNEGSETSPIKDVHLAIPDALVIPENVSLELYAYGAPYRELRQGFAATSSDVINTYPSAFSTLALNDTSDATRLAYRSAMVAGIKRGDIIMIPWYDAAYAQSLYIEAGV